MLINTEDKQKARRQGIWGIRNSRLFIGCWQQALQNQNSFNKRTGSGMRGESQQTGGRGNRFENKLGCSHRVQGPNELMKN